MDAAQPRVRVISHRHAPQTFPCPHCGKRGRRKTTHRRPVRDIAYGEILIVEITVGEYRARCSCCKTFRSQIPGVEPRAEYTNRVREAVINRLLDDTMSMERLAEALKRDFHLDLSTGFLYDCLDWKVRQVDMPEYRRWTLANFSGTLCIDEIHLGHRTLLLATDPLGDFPVAFALVSANDQEHMRRFLQNLKNWGFLARVVVTDGSNLYPQLVEAVWPEARHQLCVFHVLKDINECVLDALRRLRRQHAAKTARGKRRRGRPSRSQQRARARRGPTKKEQAYFIWKHRYLLVTRPQNLSGQQRRRLSQMFQYVPELRRLRAFVLEVYRLLDVLRTIPQLVTPWVNLINNADYLADPDLARAVNMLTPEKLAKLTVYLDSPLGQRVRTNNHVERTNRRLRHLEKVRYKWRRRRTIVRFVVLAFDHWRSKRTTAPRAASNDSTRTAQESSRGSTRRAA
jgi:transcription elongation factor Elf1